MSQQTPIRTTSTNWDFLEPAMDPNSARTMHGVLKPAGAGLTLTYPKGQVVRQKTDGTNEWAKIGTAGYLGPARIMKYPITIDENGVMQLGATFFTGTADLFKDSVDMYYVGKFQTSELTGLVVSVNETQTETMTATGGTRTITVTNPNTGDVQTTAAIAFNANAAAIQAALELLSNVAPGDIVVSGSGPYTYTFGGAYAGKDVTLMTVGAGSLTGGTSSIAAGTAGVAENITAVGRLISGTYADGIIDLGVGTPA